MRKLIGTTICASVLTAAFAFAASIAPKPVNVFMAPTINGDWEGWNHVHLTELAPNTTYVLYGIPGFNAHWIHFVEPYAPSRFEFTTGPSQTTRTEYFTASSEMCPAWGTISLYVKDGGTETLIDVTNVNMQ